MEILPRNRDIVISSDALIIILYSMISFQEISNDHIVDHKKSMIRFQCFSLLLPHQST